MTRNDETSTYVDGQLRTRHTIGGLGVLPVDTTWTYNALGDQSSESNTGGTGATANTTSYDPAGHTATYDDQTSAGIAAPNPTDVDYRYDRDDHLLARTERPTTGAASNTLYFYWGLGTTLAEETDGAGATVARYLTDGRTETIGQHTWRRDTNGHRDSLDTTGTWAWLLDDTNGNTATHLADDGTVLEQAAFDPYGRPEPAGKGRATNAPGSSLGHQGALTDKTTGNVVLGARQYDPTTARFTTPDTFVASGLDLELGTDELTGNRYVFAAANPVAFYEDGHWVSWRDLRSGSKTLVRRAVRCAGDLVCTGARYLSSSGTVTLTACYFVCIASKQSDIGGRHRWGAGFGGVSWTEFSVGMSYERGKEVEPGFEATPLAPSLCAGPCVGGGFNQMSLKRWRRGDRFTTSVINPISTWGIGASSGSFAFYNWKCKGEC